MIKRGKLLIGCVGAAAILAACSEPSSTQEGTANAAMDDMGQAYAGMAEKTQNCLKKDADACFELGQHFETVSQEKTLTALVRNVEITKAQAHYKLACEYGSKDGCKAQMRLSSETP